MKTCGLVGSAPPALPAAAAGIAVVNARFAAAQAHGECDRLAGLDAVARRVARRVGHMNDLIAAVRQERGRVQVQHLGFENACVTWPDRRRAAQAAALPD